MKNLLNLKGAKALNKKEQQSINGGSHWSGYCFPSEGKCNHYCTSSCSPDLDCGAPSNGFTPHRCAGDQQ